MGAGEIFRIFVTMLLMVGVMYLLLVVIKKYLLPVNQVVSDKLKIRNLTTHLLMPKKYISVVKIHETYYILGVSDQSITLIDKLDPMPFTEEELQATQPVLFKKIMEQMQGKK